MSKARAATTTVAAAINFVLCGLFALGAAGAILLGASVSSLEEDSAVLDDLSESLGGLLIVIGIVIGATVAWAVVLGVQILRRRPWARMAGIVTYTVFTAVAIFNAAAGARQEDGSAGPGISLAVTTALVAVLLAVGPTRRDFRQASEPVERVGPYAQALPPGVRWDPLPLDREVPPPATPPHPPADADPP